MSQALSVADFKWMTESELEDWRNIPGFLEVDLEYPIELHDSHNDYPLVHESLIINKVHKLVPNLNDKVKYILHSRASELNEWLGLKITKAHRHIVELNLLRVIG
jgi:hypothetical protein